jgi:hypothetical protein
MVLVHDYICDYSPGYKLGSYTEIMKKKNEAQDERLLCRGWDCSGNDMPPAFRPRSPVREAARPRGS